MTSQPTRPSAEPPGGSGFRQAGHQTYDLVLRVLDHQVVGPDGELIGKVDGLELVRDGHELWVTGLAIGVQPLAERLPGRLGDWTEAVWRRFHPREHPEPSVVPVTHVTSIGSAVTLDHEAAEAVVRTFGIELWLREYVVSRIPGATGGGEGRDEGPEPTAVSERRELDPRPDGMPVTRLLGLPVIDERGERLGRVWEVQAVGAPGDARQGPLRVTHVRVASHRFGADLGYGSPDQQGPALIQRPVRLFQRRDRVIPLRDVDLDSLRDGVVRLRHSGRAPGHGAR